jgi:hypothetical protein
MGGANMYIRAVFKAGHVGRGKYHEMVRYLEVENVIDAILLSKTMPRVKKRRQGQGLVSCHPINYKQYLDGKENEAYDPYLNRCFNEI